MTNSEQLNPQPIRAWAEYDEWSPYIYPTIFGEWSSVCIPKTGQESHVVAHGFARTIPDWIRVQGSELGQLRSLRVLFSTGHEMELIGWDEHIEPGGARYGWDHVWQLSVGDTCIADWVDDGSEGDQQLVQRTIDAAVQWIGQHG